MRYIAMVVAQAVVGMVVAACSTPVEAEPVSKVVVEMTYS